MYFMHGIMAMNRQILKTCKRFQKNGTYQHLQRKWVVVNLKLLGKQIYPIPIGITLHIVTFKSWCFTKSDDAFGSCILGGVWK